MRAKSSKQRCPALCFSPAVNLQVKTKNTFKDLYLGVKFSKGGLKPPYPLATSQLRPCYSYIKISTLFLLQNLRYEV